MLIPTSLFFYMFTLQWTCCIVISILWSILKTKILAQVPKVLKLMKYLLQTEKRPGTKLCEITYKFGLVAERKCKHEKLWSHKLQSKEGSGPHPPRPWWGLKTNGTDEPGAWAGARLQGTEGSVPTGHTGALPPAPTARPQPGEQAGEPSAWGPKRWLPNVHTDTWGTHESGWSSPATKWDLGEPWTRDSHANPSAPTFRGWQDSAKRGSRGGPGWEQHAFPTLGNKSVVISLRNQVCCCP